MQGGVGRYTYNLTKELRRLGLEVYVACSETGDGQFFGLSPTNVHNSDVLMKAVDEFRPDLVHIQYEPGLYGLRFDFINPKHSTTSIDSFYAKCNVPIITTFHSAYTFRQWLRLGSANFTKRCARGGLTINNLAGYWRRLINFNSFNRLNRSKAQGNSSGIVFSNYMLNLVTNKENFGNVHLIYHGSEPAISTRLTKREARAKFGLPQDGQLALALGFRTPAKGWDLFERMKVPDGWNVVISSSENHYIKCDLRIHLEKVKNIYSLNTYFLTDPDLSSLFYASDALILPYTVSSGSGVMFDGLAHGLPFVATDLEFFKEFSAQGLGITVRRNPHAFEKGLSNLSSRYAVFKEAVDIFKKKLSWNTVAIQHVELYQRKRIKPSSSRTSF